MGCEQNPPAKIEVKLSLHPHDLNRALAIAKAANIAERDFFALAIHLGTAQIQKAAKARQTSARVHSLTEYRKARAAHTGEGLRSVKPS
jgi:hypothetical protein